MNHHTYKQTLISFFFRATSEAYGSSQGRGWIRAAAASLHHCYSNSGSMSHPWPKPQQHWILHPVSEARDQTHNLMETSQEWVFFVCFFFFLLFFGLHLRHMEVLRLVLESELQRRPIPQQQWIQATPTTDAAACDNARSLIHWARRGIKPTSSRTLYWVPNPLSHISNSHIIYSCVVLC